MDIKKQYVEIASGSVSNRGKVMQLSELRDFISKMESDREVYYSWYCFNVNLKNHIEKTKTIQNYKGVYNVNQIILDFDKANLSDTELLDYMRYFISDEIVDNYQIPDSYYTIWYSGTGFHIHLANCFNFEPDIHLPNIVRATMAELFPEADNIFDGARLIRAGGTVNNKSGFYKTKINREDLFRYDMTDIQEMSNKKTNEDNFGLWFDEEVTIEPNLSHLVKKPKISTQPLSAKRHKIKGDPNAIVTCMQKAYQAGPIQGQRNETMMRIASWLRRNGTPQDVVELGLQNWSGLQKESHSVTKQVFKEGYQYGCDDPIMAQWCSSKCIYYKRKDFSLNIKSAKQVEEEYREWIKQDYQNKSFNFADIWEMRENQNYVVYPGELIIVLGDTGLGKTAFVQNLVALLPHMSCLYLTLEVSNKLMYRRFCQLTHSLKKDTINEDHMNDESNYSREFSQIQFLCEPIEMTRLEKQVGETPPKILVIDTTDAINIDSVYNEFERMNTIINRLKALAINQDIIIIGVHHINKESAKNSWTDLHSAKGSSTVVQKADKVIAINGDRNKLLRFVNSEKSRDESRFKMTFEFQPQTFKWEQTSL